MHLIHPISVLLVTSTIAHSAPGADLAKIARTIATEPVYKARPQYCLLVFGAEADFRVWLVQDGETLYVDRNGDGDLTEPRGTGGLEIERLHRGSGDHCF
jgi:hypothetical protein